MERIRFHEMAVIDSESLNRVEDVEDSRPLSNSDNARHYHGSVNSGNANVQTDCGNTFTIGRCCSTCVCSTAEVSNIIFGSLQNPAFSGQDNVEILRMVFFPYILDLVAIMMIFYDLNSIRKALSIVIVVRFIILGFMISFNYKAITGTEPPAIRSTINGKIMNKWILDIQLLFLKTEYLEVIVNWIITNLRHKSVLPGYRDFFANAVTVQDLQKRCF